ncbi:MAG: type II secretion system protein GspK, partial [Zetaproteobacteria bacterium]|nr:type II secretion system protein GspK [Zetaproteobacteria bacterium]
MKKSSSPITDKTTPSLAPAEFSCSGAEPVVRGRKGERGVALMIALFSIIMMVSFVSDLIISSTVQINMAAASRDKIKSEYLAKSGANLGIYVVSASFLMKKAIQNGTLPIQSSATDGPSSLWAMVNSWPAFGRETVDFVRGSDDKLSQQESDVFGVGGLLNEKVANQMSMFEDAFSVKIRDESAKINLSGCNHSSAVACKDVVAQLEALFSCPVEEAFLESYNLKPREMAYRIRDFISSRSEANSESNIDSKDGPYQRSETPYESKKFFLDSLEELRLVHGWNQDIHEVFKPYLTIYPFHRRIQPRKVQSLININTAPRELMACLLPESLSSSARENMLQVTEKQKNKGQDVAATQGEIAQQLRDTYSYAEEGEEQSEVEKRANWFKVDSDVFRVEVSALTGRQSRKHVLVVRQVDNETKDELIVRRDVK